MNKTELRDRFAMQAMLCKQLDEYTAAIVHSRGLNFEDVADECYEFADAMMKARERVYDPE